MRGSRRAGGACATSPARSKRAAHALERERRPPASMRRTRSGGMRPLARRNARGSSPKDAMSRRGRCANGRTRADGVDAPDEAARAIRACRGPRARGAAAAARKDREAEALERAAACVPRTRAARRPGSRPRRARRRTRAPRGSARRSSAPGGRTWPRPAGSSLDARPGRRGSRSCSARASRPSVSAAPRASSAFEHDVGREADTVESREAICGARIRGHVVPIHRS